MLDINEASSDEQYSVLVIVSNGYAEDSRGDFQEYDDAYDEFEKTVSFLDSLSSTVDSYPLSLDTVQLLRGSALILIWQRPPIKTEQLLVAWAKRRGYSKPQIIRTRFVGISVTPQKTVAIDRRGIKFP